MARLLICDDDPMVRLVLQAAVERRGHIVTVCVNGDELTSALEETSFALCIMDVSMPGASFEARMEVLGDRAPDMPVMVLSGSVADDWPSPPNVIRLRKPVDLKTFEQALEKMGVS